MRRRVIASQIFEKNCEFTYEIMYKIKVKGTIHKHKNEAKLWWKLMTVTSTT